MLLWRQYQKYILTNKLTDTSTSHTQKKILVYAPNIHVGGGLVLLNDFLIAAPPNAISFLILDIRAQASLNLQMSGKIAWVKNTFFSRMFAEIKLAYYSSPSEIVFCFHGLPPLLPNRGRVFVFLQNYHYFGVTNLSGFSTKVAFRIRLEKLIARIFSVRVNKYIVQTRTMMVRLKSWLMDVQRRNQISTEIEILPFINFPTVDIESRGTRQYDFIYIADGSAHKNHRCLIDGWIELYKSGLRPSLALTLDLDRDAALIEHVKIMTGLYDLKIVNLGTILRSNVLSLYNRSGALIFPSLAESFGIPLLEAKIMGLPIIASELDYVRDVCSPIQTFDPLSPMSIARAVKRYMQIEESPETPLSVGEFWKKIMSFS